MVDLLISLVQVLCLVGYLYGAWLVITHSTRAEGQNEPARPRLAPAARLPDETDAEALRRFLAYDR